MSIALHNASASIWASRSRCLSYVMGQSMHTHAARGVATPVEALTADLRKGPPSPLLPPVVDDLPLPEPPLFESFAEEILSIANVEDDSGQPLHAAHTLATASASCSAAFRRPIPRNAAETLSWLHLAQTTALALPLALHFAPHSAQESLPK